MKRVVLGLSLIVLWAVSFAGTELKVGIVNMEEVFKSSVKYKRDADELNKKAETMNKEITDEQKALQKTIENFSKDAPTMKEDAKEQEQRKISDAYKKLQEKQLNYQKDMAAKAEKLNKDLQSRLEAATKKVAEAEKLDAVMVKNLFIYNKQEMDVTNKVLDHINKK